MGATRILNTFWKILETFTETFGTYTQDAAETLRLTFKS